MSFKEYLRNKEEGGISAFSIIKDTVGFLTKNMLSVVIIAALILSLFTALTGASSSGMDFFNSSNVEESSSLFKDIFQLIAPFLQAAIVTLLIVQFLNKANNKDEDYKAEYLSAISKVFLLTILANLFAILLGGVLGMLVFVLDIFIVLVFIVTYLYAFFISTVQNAICEEPSRSLKRSLSEGADTFFKKKFILKALVLVIIFSVILFIMYYLFNLALGVEFNVTSKAELSKAVAENGFMGRAFLFIYSFLTNVLTIVIQMCFSSLYLIYSRPDTKPQDDERLNDLVEKLNGEKEEEKNDFFEIYSNNMYKGKDDK